MDAKELASLMADNASVVAEYLFPAGKKSGKEWKVGGISGDVGQSLSICIGGSKKGVWKDFQSGDGGDLLDAWAKCRALSIAEAMREAKQFLGIKDQMPKRAAVEYKKPARPKCSQPKTAVMEWLSLRGISEKSISDYKIAEQSIGGNNYVLFPYLREEELVNVKYRNINNKKDMRQEVGAEPCLFGWHLIEPRTRYIAITEGELDCISLHQIGIQALSINAGAGNHQWIDNDWSRLERFSEIYLCYDDDDAGHKGAKEVANRLGLERCRIVKFPKKDANEYLMCGAGKDEFAACLADAKTFDPEELRPISDFWGGVQELFYPTNRDDRDPVLSLCGESQQWMEFRGGEITVWTGYNGHGKSLLLNQVMIGLMMQGERACVFSGEMRPERQGKRMAKQLGGVDRPTPDYLNAMGEWLRERMWVFDLVGSASIDRLLTVFKYGYKRYGIRHFVIDSLMMTDVPEDGAGAMSEQKEAMRKLASFARGNNTHIHLVAHPRKGIDEKKSPGKMDVAGSSKLTDAADNVFSVWSAQKRDDDPDIDKPDSYLTLWKQRNGDTQHKGVALFFNRECMQFGTNKNRRPHTYIKYMGRAQEAEYHGDER